MRNLFLIGFLFFSFPAWATTWYVRDGGGNYGTTSTTCNGQTNAVYVSNGGPNCAVSNLSSILGITGWNGTSTQRISGGDTVYVVGDSDTSPGTQAQYLTGYGMPDPGGICSVSGTYDCKLRNVPAGSDNSHRTSIIGTGTNKPQLYGFDRPAQVIELDNNYIALQWIEITDHEQCGYVAPVQGCSGSPGYDDGIQFSGTGMLFTDVYVHGFSRYGLIANSDVGDATFTRLYSMGNGYGGFTIGNGNTPAVTGTITMNQPIIDWNGCIEDYPISNSGVNNPLNYHNCYGQGTNGYGDGLAFGPDGGQSAGNWTITGPGSISFNTQDGFDTLHGAGSGTMQIDKMRFEGNGGQQIKMNALNSYITNSLIIGDCGWWYQASQSASGAMALGDTCRANGDVILFNVTNGSTTNIFNNTILSNGSIVAESKDLGSTGCNGSTHINLKNNIISGGYSWGDDTSFNGAGGNSLTTYIYNDGNDGNGAGTCGSLTWTEDYNIVNNTKSSNANCVGAHDKCGTSPGFSNTFPMGTSGGAANTFYQGTSGITLISLGGGSAAIGAGVAGLSYWNDSKDYLNVSRASPPSMGGLEASSCAATSYGCFFNSDCCSNSCTNNACDASSGSSTVTRNTFKGSSKIYGRI